MRLTTHPARPGPGSRTAYRADIDGLRGLAIAAVVLYHAGFEFASGGYVGVDVFFVISGYLITTLLRADWSAGRFSLVEFYERRIRRLFPALFVVLLACTLAALWLLVPRELSYYGGSLVATVLFASNLYFWLRTGYFEVAAETEPLLHTWSLAVEEQFYLVFPLLLWLLMRRAPRRAFAVLAVLAVVSLGASEWGVRQWEDAAFYLAPLRGWELGLGVLVALSSRPPPRDRRVLDGLSFVGLAAIAASIGLYSWRTPFPGLSALLPCAGTALLIWTGTDPRSVVARWLRAAPLVRLGLISYSLYLWHWPLLVYARVYAVRDLAVSELVAIVVLSTVIAALSWRYVEQPFRGPRGLMGRAPLVRLAGGLATVCVLLGLGAVLTTGWPQRFDGAALALLAGAEDRNPRRQCSFLTASELRAGRACRLGDAAERPDDFIVWGDSHADALMPAFDALATRYGQSGLYLGKIGCPPLLGVERNGSKYRCEAFNDAAMQLIERSPARTVVLVARWSHYTAVPTYGHEHHTRVIIADARASIPSTRANEAVLARGLERSLTALAGRRVYVVRTAPEVGYDVPVMLARMHHVGRDVPIEPTVSEYRARQQRVTTLLTRLEATHDFAVLDPGQRLCASGRCQLEADGRSLYLDHHHLSVHGADYISGIFEPIFTPSRDAAVDEVRRDGGAPGGPAGT